MWNSEINVVLRHNFKLQSQIGYLMKTRLRVFLFLIILSLVLCASVYQLPPIKDRLAWRVDELRAQAKYAFSPPEQVVFVPGQQADLFTPAPLPSATLAPTPINPTKSAVGASEPTPTLALTSTPTVTPSPLPEKVQLLGVKHEYQGWNNCGPATLAMALSYWKWQGDQYEIASFTKPNDRDKNVMPYEMANFVETQTDFRVTTRIGGELQLLQRLIASRIPVIVEKGFEGTDFDGWMGHYELITGYDNQIRLFTAQDSYMGPDLEISYDTLVSNWRAFNFTYLIVYPEDREVEVLALLGPHADEASNLQTAAQKASTEINALAGRDQFFAWFNRGTGRVALQDFAGAARAYDEAFALYPSIPEKERPWRMMWYQTGPYWAYYYTGRYQDVIELATKTLDNMSEPVLEESYYWRGMAREAMGDISGAIEDFRAGLKTHPGFEPALEQLKRLGAESE